MTTTNMSNRALLAASTGAKSLKEALVENDGIMEGELEGSAFDDEQNLAYIVLGGVVYGTNSQNVIRAAEAHHQLVEGGDTQPVEATVSVGTSSKGREYIKIELR